MYPSIDKLCPTPLATIPVYCLYIDQDQEIIKISVNHHSFTNKIIDKNQLLKLVHCNSITHNDSKYCFRNMMLYHLHHDKTVLDHIYDENDSSSCFKDSLYEVNIYKDLVIPDSLPIFHDINSLLVFFHEKKSSLKRNRHGIYDTNDTQDTPNTQNTQNTHNTQHKKSSITTKRVRIRDIPNKTRRCR